MRRLAALGALLLVATASAGCLSRGAQPRFARDAEPTVQFVDLMLADYALRATEPVGAVRVRLRIRNRSAVPIELYQVQARLESNVRAITQNDSAILGGIQSSRPGLIAVQASIPSEDERVVEFPMTLTSAVPVSQSSGRLIPALRGQLFFRTPQGEVASSFFARLTDFEDIDDDED
jgi:hypothetical protein